MTLRHGPRRFRVVQRDNQNREIWATDEKGRFLWKRQVPIGTIKRLEITDGGKALRVSAADKVATIETRTGSLISMLEQATEQLLLKSEMKERSPAPRANSYGQEQLLELDVQATKLKVEAAEAKLRAVEQKSLRGNLLDGEISQAHFAVKLAKVELRRAEIQLALYRKSRKSSIVAPGIPSIRTELPGPSR